MVTSFCSRQEEYITDCSIISGSYTRHDLLPWDDDIDLRVPISYRNKLQAIVRGNLSSEPYSIKLIQMHNHRNYDKVFFSWSPPIDRVPWTFPFIDIFYDDANSTHVWLIGTPSDCPVRREDIFPLVRRPLGPLWLYGPREPMAHFESRKMKRIDTGCFAFPYSHKYEKQVMPNVLYANCTALKSFYPYLDRQCAIDKCTETLMLGENTVIHSLTYNYTYRTFLYAERNATYRAC